MSLSVYKKKRDFKQTAEPLPEIGKQRGARTFVIQRHNASRLHYDFRLEVNGVLKSWAVPKGPSLNPTDKRLAMMVEDHPLSYGSFKGVIPEGNYGAGIVEIWDHGTYDPEEMEKVSDNAIEKNIKNGMLKFSLKGRKLKGSFALVRIKGADSKNWLLIKHRDQYATEEPYSSEDDTPANSPINKQLKQKESVSTAKTKGTDPKKRPGVSANTAEALTKSSSAKASVKKSSRKVPGKSGSVKQASLKHTSVKKVSVKKASETKTPVKNASAKKSSSGKRLATNSLKKK